MRMATLTIAFAAVVAIATTAPVLAANDQGASASTQIKHSMTTRHQHHASLQARENGALISRSTANANASADTPVKDESMASQLAKTVTVPGNASDPICKLGSMTPLGDGRMHPCQ